MNEFKKYFDEFRCEKGMPYTHTSIGNPKACINVPDDKIAVFYENYNRAKVQGVLLHLTEKPTDPSPMRVDLDFRFIMPDPKPKSNSLPRLYTSELVEKILKKYFELLTNYLVIKDQDLTAYVMEKPCATEYKNKIKDGLHIVWPNIVVNHTFQHLIRKHILDDATIIFQGIPVCNTFDDIVDQAIIDKNNWQMYGSRKPECNAYRVTYVYSYNQISNEVIKCPDPSAEDELKFVELFSMRNKQNLLVSIKPDKKDEVEQYIKHVLPSLDDRRKNKLHGQIFGDSLNLVKNHVTDDELDLARKLVGECLCIRRAENYEDWIKLGWTLRNIDYRLLDTWVSFSGSSSKYIEGECQLMWNKMRSDTLGMGTLRWWARQDNPIKYHEILDGNVLDLVDKCISTEGAHYDVAKVVHIMYKDRYRFTSKDIWYTFIDEKHRWVRNKEGLKLRMVLSNEVCSKFMERSMYWSNQAVQNSDSEMRDRYSERSKKLLGISVRLKTAGYKDSVMKECKGLFTDEKFDEILDNHQHLLGFENGVYDLRLHEFRDGLPDDYTSFTTGRHYQKYNQESTEAHEINEYLSQVFTNPNVRKYMKDILSCIIDGGIRQEKFYVFTGFGCHAKNTEILLYNGTKKLVQDITETDVLMGDDSTPRNIIQLCRGTGSMYRIIPIKGESFVVNDEHILSLKFTNMNSLSKQCNYDSDSNSISDRWRVYWYIHNGVNEPIKKSKTFKSTKEAIEFMNIDLPNLQDIIKKGDIIDIKVSDLLKWNPWWIQKGNLNLFKSESINFSKQEITLDPYILGCWLGDEHSRNTCITTMNREIIEYFKAHIPPNHDFHAVSSRNGKAKTYNITYTGKKERYISNNEIFNNLRKYNLIMNKHIPSVYKINTREIRLKVLAGILDTDGCYQKHTNQYTLTLKSEKLIDDVVDLVRSLGLVCYKKSIKSRSCNNGKYGNYFRLNILGNGIEEIPCLLPRKKAVSRNKEKNSLLNSFKIEQVGTDNFYGFELDGNHRYLMGDFTVTHNSNSKSALLNLVQKTIGDYYCILPIALLTQKRTASNNAQSELERTKGRRLSVMQEPGEGEKLNIGLMKELSGGDRILVRGLFKEPIEFRPQFKMIMTCNELPEVPSDDGGTWRRIRVVEFTSKFLDNPDPNKPNEFPLDPELMPKFDKWADTFISMMIEHHKNFDPKNMTEPREVTNATEGYKKNNDVIGQFISERMVKDETSTDRILVNKVFTDFKSWAYQNVQKGKKVPDRNQFRSYMEKLFGIYPSNGKGWLGIRYISQSVNDADSDVE